MKSEEFIWFKSDTNLGMLLRRDRR